MDRKAAALMDPLKAAHVHEQYVTGLINNIYAAAQAGRSYSEPSLQL